MNGELIEWAASAVWKSSLWTVPMALTVVVLGRGRWGSARLRWWLAVLVMIRLLVPVTVWTVDVPTWPTKATVEAGPEWSLAAPEAGASLIEATAVRKGVRGIAWVWIGGMTVVLGWALVGQARAGWWVRRRRVEDDVRVTQVWERLNGSRRVGLVTLTGLDQVALFGFFRPRVLVPEWLGEVLSEAEMEGVLRHELAHVRRGDIAWNWLGIAVVAVHWFNPVVWLLVWRLRADTEILCDALALRATGVRDYGRAMLKVVERVSASVPVGLTSFAQPRTNLQHRIQMMTHRTSTSLSCRLLAVVFGMAFGAVLLTAADGDRPKEGVRDGDRPKEGMRDGDRPKDGEKDGDRAKREGGARDGDRPREGMSDGDRAKTEGGARDGDRPREGMGDGDRARAAGGARDGDRPREGMSDGDRARAAGGARDGDRPREGMGDGAARSPEPGGSVQSAPAAPPPMVLTLNAQGQVINGAGEVVPEAEVKQKLEQILGANPGQAFTIQGDQATPYQHVLKLYEMVQGLGGKSVGLEGFK